MAGIMKEERKERLKKAGASGETLKV